MDAVDALNAASSRLRIWEEGLPDTDHVRWVKSFDWSKTDLGPIQEWPVELLLWTQQLLADSRPTTIYWSVASAFQYCGYLN